MRRKNIKSQLKESTPWELYKSIVSRGDAFLTAIVESIVGDEMLREGKIKGFASAQKSRHHL